jgi:long-chain fatty acid transport protein
LFLHGTAFAGGFEYPDNGTIGIGRGGAFTAKANDLSAIYYNPAGLVKTKGKFNLLYNHNFTKLDINYNRIAWDYEKGDWHKFPDSENPVNNQYGFFNWGVLFGFSSDFGTEDFVLAMGIYGPPAVGAATFPQDGSQKYMLVKRDILLTYYNLSGAYRISKNLSLGISLQLVDLPKNRFSLVVDGYYLQTYYPFGSEYDVLTSLDVKERFKNITAIVGILWQPHESFELGFAGRIIPIYFDAEGNVKLQMLGAFVQPPPDKPNPDNKIYDKQTGKEDSRVTFSYVLPPQLRMGGRYIYHSNGRELFDIELDFFYEFWSMLDAFNIDFKGDKIRIELQDGSLLDRDLKDIKLMKKYKDTYSIRLGGDFNVIKDMLTFRLGGFYESPATRKEYTYIDFVSFHSFGLGAGLTFNYKGMDITTTYLHIFQPQWEVNEDESKVEQQRPTGLCGMPGEDPAITCSPYYQNPDGTNRLGPPSNSGIYKSSYDVISIGLTIHFDNLFSNE